MSQTVISVENLSKSYQLGVIGTGTFYGDLQRWWAQQRGRPDPYLKVGDPDFGNRENDTIWALKDANFSVERGEALGIIGRNGAGKSTLLKVLSQVTAPTSGTVKVKGRIASLLEVGTGFHPELTGRENIYLNGAIMGMNRAEIKRKFDEIVDFSGVERFIDTPVKRYSSGMYVRLAFAVAAHLEPEILIVDEVLAVGDAAFQKKCLGKMEDVSHHGRTVLFVSHNIGAIVSLCNRCLLLENGKIIKDGSTSEVIEVYQSSFYHAVRDLSDLSLVERYGTGKAQFRALEVTPVNDQDATESALITGGDLKIDLTIHATENVVDANVAVIIYDSTGFRLIDVSTALQGCYLTLKSGQSAKVEFQLHDLFLKPGAYFLGLWLGRHNFEDIDGINYVTSVTVEPKVDDLKHSINFPGVYQCQFTQRVTIS
jgi:lipopolysaccharide transport system ATP-binding protein